jgi:pyruvate,water dikinase
MTVPERNTPRISWFAELGITDRTTVGGKGASLGELIRAGAAVPPGFVVTTAAFETFLRTLDPDGRIRRRIDALAGADAAAIEETCQSIRRELDCAPLSEELHAEIGEAYRRLCGDQALRPVAVRSSATSEDHSEASFAGLQDTFLWIKGIDEVISGTKRCWASLYSVESVTYRLRLNLPEDEVAMAVVVQDMVDARTAGVMFTRSPTTGDKSVVVIEASWGLGSALVSGEVTPDRFVISKITGEVSKRDISRKTLQHVPDPDQAKVIDVAVPEHLQAVTCVSDDEIRALVHMAKAIEQHYGHAQDIEWAINRRESGDGRILLLQSRPETVWSNRGQENKSIDEVDKNPLAHVLRALSNRGP